MFDNNNDNSSSDIGILGKFRERLRKIKIIRSKKGKKIKDEENSFIKDKVREIKEKVEGQKNVDELNFIPQKKVTKIRIVKKTKYKGIVSNLKKDKLVKNNLRIKGYSNKNNSPKETKEDNQQDKLIENVITRIRKTREDRDYTKRGIGIDKNTKSPTNSKTKGNNYKTKENKSKDNLLLDELKYKIISKIKTDFNKKIAELEVLESELYNLSEQNKNELELKKVNNIKEEINNIIKKINNIIEEYNIYRTNYNLEDIIDLSDKILVDDIINYKHLVETDFLNKELVNNYKLLKEFQILYNKLDEIKTVTDNLVVENKEKITELRDKESKNDATNEEIKTATETLKYCDQEIIKQNEYFAELIKKVDIIDKKEYTTYKFKGIGNIFNTIATYISTIALSKKIKPVPRIFIRTLATNYLLKNLYNSLKLDEVNKIEYNAKNYDREILEKINDIDFTYELINDTLYTIKDLKSDFLQVYNSNIPGFKDTLKKLDKIEEKIINNRYQMDTIKTNLNISRKRNDEKIKKLEKLKQSA